MIEVKVTVPPGPILEADVRTKPMPASEDRPEAPLHPIRESAGFILTVGTAVALFFWPFRRSGPAVDAAIADEVIVGEAEPVHISLKKTLSHLAPFPIDD